MRDVEEWAAKRDAWAASLEDGQMADLSLCGLLARVFNTHIHVVSRDPMYQIVEGVEQPELYVRTYGGMNLVGIEHEV